MVRRLLAALALACAAAAAASAEVRPSIELTLLDTLTRTGDWEAGLAAAGLGKLSLDAAPSETLRGQLAVDARVGDTTEAEVTRAYVRVRTPAWRTTHGLAPMSWGQGFFYNAADVVFGPVGSTADITAKELRDLAVWQTTVFVPLGPFSFVEAALLAPGLELAASEPPDIGDTAAGARFLGRVGATQIEAGSLYRGADGTHNPFVSLHGSLYVDLYAGVSAALPQAGAGRRRPAADAAGQLRALSRPAPSRRDGPRGPPRGARAPRRALAGRRRRQRATGCSSTPSLSGTLGPKLSLLSRNFLSPVDVSALCVLGLDWRMQTGLSLLAFASVQAGGSDDTYGWGREGDLAATAGFRYRY